LGSLEKSNYPVCHSETSVLTVSEKNEEEAKLEDLKIQCTLEQENELKVIKGKKIEENQVRSRNRKNRIIRFANPDYPIFPKQIESK
jgi:hypothetical protein